MSRSARQRAAPGALSNGPRLLGAPEPRDAPPFSGPRALKEPGSIPWCYQTLELLKIRWEREQFVAAEFKAILEEAKAHRIWERIPPERPYGDPESMLVAELGTTMAAAERRILSHEEAGKEGGRGHKAPRGARGFSDDAAYRMARLKREWPALYACVQRGEISVHAAAIEAGLRKRMMRVPIEPVAAARALRRHFSAAQLDQMIALLQEGA